MNLEHIISDSYSSNSADSETHFFEEAGREGPPAHRHKLQETAHPHGQTQEVQVGQVVRVAKCVGKHEGHQTPLQIQAQKLNHFLGPQVFLNQNSRGKVYIDSTNQQLQIQENQKYYSDSTKIIHLNPFNNFSVHSNQFLNQSICSKISSGKSIETFQKEYSDLKKASTKVVGSGDGLNLQNKLKSEI
eukprot:CAMPEP_0116946298 /NCGR_PEP_ID=MMETSP0467-20121206/36889_1 /TAXON_ID=283647 /ORGANISM="Mesodinium pulex, Strain SPMC105" /LENGTH=187 /DNA_ID=CAMNT_0004630023 /DNA_START=495 /DNA_END=1059 /DNA_ORIENTATION=-